MSKNSAEMRNDMYNRRYNIGLNLELTSAGWAVTDENGKLLRAKGKDMWGVRLFDEAESGAERRMYRYSRKKRQRKLKKIRELNTFFSEEIKKTDPGFFIRLEESMLWEEDRSEENRQPFSLFCDKNHTDLDFYKKYPTIYHLRLELANSKEPHDIRLLYLTLLHMFKHRGHFLQTESDRNPSPDKTENDGIQTNTLKNEENSLQYRKFICEEKVAVYEKHKEDLKKLKHAVKSFFPDAYDEMFRIMKDGLANYSAYAGSVNNGGEKSRRNDSDGKMKPECKSRERFYKYVTKLLSPKKQEAEVKEILDEIKKKTFLPKLSGTENRKNPNQIYTEEMKAILHNASTYFSFLNETDENGKTTSERILDLFTFCLPIPTEPEEEQEAAYSAGMQTSLDDRVEKSGVQTDLTAQDFEDEFLYTPYRRMVWQAYRIINELIEIQGKKPEHIYLKLFGQHKKTTAEAEELQKTLEETRTGALHILRIFKEAFPQTGVTVLKESLVRDIRKKYFLPGISIINDFGSAEEAYLCAVTGKAYEPFFHDTLPQEEKTAQMKENLAAVISVVKSTLKRKTPLITKRCFSGNGGIYNKDTIRSAKIANKETYLPHKLTNERIADVTKYGGRTCINNMCYTLVAYQVNGKEIRSIEALPVYLGKPSGMTEEKITEYLLPKIKEEFKKKEVTDFRICLKTLKYRSLLKINGYYYYLGGKTGYRLSLENAVQWKTDETHKRFIKKIFRAVDRNDFRELTAKENIELYQYILNKINTTIYSFRTNFVGNFLKEKEKEFERLELSEQCRFLVSLMEGFETGTRKVNMHLLGGSPNSGVMFLNKKISECSEVLLIHQSVTGLFSEVINLLKI